MSMIGILNLNKPSGLSSRQAVDRVERLTRPTKAGHAGTLDPLASGVLVICVGQATRLIQYIQQMPKCYRASFLLGRCSDTDDVEGDIVLLADAPAPDRAMLDRVLPQFVGEIEQRPPIYSAVKLAGRRAYQLARRGKAVELAARRVTVHRLMVRRYEYPELELEVECGSGTYVRALGRDLAGALGTGAVMSSLERTAIGGFRLEDAAPLDELTAEMLAQHLQPALLAVATLPRVTLSDAQLAEIRHGRPIATSVPTGSAAATIGAEFAALNSAGGLVAILREKQVGQLWPKLNLV